MPSQQRGYDSGGCLGDRLRPTSILEDLIEGRIGIAEFRTRTIQQHDHVDAGVDWTAEWGREVDDALEQTDGDAEVVYYPEAPEESYITEDELMRSCRDKLRKLRKALEE